MLNIKKGIFASNFTFDTLWFDEDSTVMNTMDTNWGTAWYQCSKIRNNVAYLVSRARIHFVKILSGETQGYLGLIATNCLHFKKFSKKIAFRFVSNKKAGFLIIRPASCVGNHWFITGVFLAGAFWKKCKNLTLAHFFLQLHCGVHIR